MTGQLVATEVDVSAVQDALSETTKSLKSISKATLRVVAKATAKTVRAAIISSDLHVRTGELRKAYTYKVKRDGSEANVYPRALTNGDRTIFPKAMTLSYGHNGPTKRFRNWRIAPRGFVQRGQQFAENGGYMDEVQKLIDKELEKYWS
jgi:hypothetical protein